MSLLGLGWFKSKEERDTEQKIYNQMIFPLGDKQKDTITTILLDLIPDESKENLIYNYVVTKQELKDINPLSINKNELIELTTYLSEHYISSNSDVFKYLTLAYIDLKIDRSLNYPSIEEINNIANTIKNKLN